VCNAAANDLDRLLAARDVNGAGERGTDSGERDGEDAPNRRVDRIGIGCVSKEGWVTSMETATSTLTCMPMPRPGGTTGLDACLRTGERDALLLLRVPRLKMYGSEDDEVPNGFIFAFTVGVLLGDDPIDPEIETPSALAPSPRARPPKTSSTGTGSPSVRWSLAILRRRASAVAFCFLSDPPLVL
jgi:hypothetical protein